jgi:hypothetical protein
MSEFTIGGVSRNLALSSAKIIEIQLKFNMRRANAGKNRKILDPIEKPTIRKAMGIMTRL